MKHATVVLLTAIMGATAPAWAAPANDGQVWTAVLGSAKLSNRTTGASLWMDLHFRRSGANLTHIARPGIGWRWTPQLSTWVGYAWIPVDHDAGGTTHEHRAWQQLILKHSVGTLSLQARTRFEQRIRQDGDDVGFRARQFVRSGWQPTPDSRMGLVAWDELFVGMNDTDWGARSGFDQNRLFVGGFVKIEELGRLELGYLSLYVRRPGQDLVGHVLATNLFVIL